MTKRERNTAQFGLTHITKNKLYFVLLFYANCILYTEYLYVSVSSKAELILLEIVQKDMLALVHLLAWGFHCVVLTTDI